MSYINILSLILLYWLVIILLDRRGVLKRYNITAYGPILMIRTTRGQRLLDKIARPKKFWRIFANIGLPAMLIGMFVMFALILLFDFFLIRSFQTQTVPPPSKLTELQSIFLIPGVNPFIPLVWGIIALFVTLVVHEFSHATLCKVEGIKVKSMGVLLAIIPIGGFAEPDEDQLLGKRENKSEKEATSKETEPKKLATRGERIRVLASGVMANFVTALIAFILFFSLLGSLSPVGNVMVTTVLPGYPADLAGVEQNMILTGIDDKQVNSAHDFLLYAKTLEPGRSVTLNLIDHGLRKEINLATAASNETRSGVRIIEVKEGSPAQKAGIQPGMILIKIDNTEIRGKDDIIAFMSSAHEGQKVDVYLMSNSSIDASLLVFKNIELAKDPDSKKGILGISYLPESAVSYSLGIGVAQYRAKEKLDYLKGFPSLLTGPYGWLLLFSFPFTGLDGEGFVGFSDIITYFYEPAGWAAMLGIGIFWMLNILLWIGWMNFYVGLFNCLPAVPLDGGHVFRDVMQPLLTKFIGNGKRVERLSNAIVIAFALLILTSFIFMFAAPYLAHGL